MGRSSFTAADSLRSSAAPHPERPGVLATLVHTEGSAYQKAGAQLYIDPQGSIFGLVSGGCLEQAIIEEALSLRDHPEAPARLTSYDTSDPSDVEFGFGLGCGGKLWVFFETVASRAVLQRKIQALAPRASLEAIVIAAPQNEWLGQRRLLRLADGVSATEELPHAEAHELTRTLDQLLAKAQTQGPERSQLYQEGPLSVALLRRPETKHLSIFGAGPGAWPLAAMAQSLGWAVRVYDHRPDYLEDFPETLGEKCFLPRGEISQSQYYPVPFEEAAAVIMTHNFGVDQLLLARLIEERWGYIGLLGSHKRCDKLRAELKKAGQSEQLAQRPLFAPAGLTLGGDDVQSIALALLAEIQAVLSAQTQVQFRRDIRRAEG